MSSRHPKDTDPANPLYALGPVHCPHCDKVFDSRNSMMRHAGEKHGGIRPYRCRICDPHVWTHRRYNMDRHYERYHPHTKWRSRSRSPHKSSGNSKRKRQSRSPAATSSARKIGSGSVSPDRKRKRDSHSSHSPSGMRLQKGDGARVSAIASTVTRVSTVTSTITRPAVATSSVTKSMPATMSATDCSLSAASVPKSPPAATVSRCRDGTPYDTPPAAFSPTKSESPWRKSPQIQLSADEDHQYWADVLGPPCDFTFAP